MKKATAASVVVVTLCALIFTELGSGQAGDPKGEPWKNFLPPEVYKELVSRELKTVQAGIDGKGEKDVSKGKVAALMIASLTLSAKDGKKEELEGVRAAAFRLAEILGEKDKADEAKKLAAAIATGKGDPGAKNQGTNFRTYVPNEYDLMVMYMGKEKGGDGLHPDLQFSPRLQGTQEFIESLFSYLAKTKKTLLDKSLKKASDELTLTAYRTAVSAELIHSYVPKTKTKKRDPELWVKTAGVMRDSALSLADAAKKQDADAIIKSSATLLDSCVQCHKMFQ